jgi:predicted permease
MQVVLQPIALLLIIAAGYTMKRTGIVTSQGYRVLEQAIIWLTLPADIIYSFTVNNPERNMLWISLFGFVCALLPIPFLFLVSRKRPITQRFFLMINGSGSNVGNFTFPVIQALMGMGAILPSVMYDIGNCIVVSATSNAVTSAMLKIPADRPLKDVIEVDENGNEHLHVEAQDEDARRIAKRHQRLAVFKSFITSPSFDVYILLILLLLFGIRLPKEVATFLKPIADANTFCSMAMIGMLMEMPSSKREAKQVAEVFGWRLGFSLLFVAASFLLPFDLRTRTIVAISTLSPASIFATMFTDKALGDAKSAGFTLTLTCISSLIIMTVIYFVAI